MATIKKIARLAGVSPTTVSNVLHGNTAKVSPATLEKVNAILKQEKYAPNMGAIILAHNNSRIIGVIMFVQPRDNETVIEDPFTSAILGSLEQEIKNAGYFTMIHTTGDEEDVLRLASTWKLDGLVLLWVPDEMCGRILDSVETPIVFIDCYYHGDHPRYRNIGLDDRRGGREIANYLMSMGHRNVAFLANASEIPGSDLSRFEGCRLSYAESGTILSIDCFIPLSKEAHEREAQYDAVLADTREFTALIMSSDYYAAEAILHYQAQGIDVPERVSITGFDDNIFGRLIRPRLTTVHQDVAAKGRLAVDTLMRLIRGEETAERDVRLPVRLEIRNSVKRAE